MFLVYSGAPMFMETLIALEQSVVLFINSKAVIPVSMPNAMNAKTYKTPA
jgi:hypothetical protein